MPSPRNKRVFLTVLAGRGGAALTYSISGIVYDADGTTPVEGATVALGALSAVSGADGTYTIVDVPAGTIGSMTCTLAGYSWTAITVSAMSGNLTTQNYTNAIWALGGIGANCIGAYQAIGAASQAASYINLANPGTNNCTEVTVPTWDAVNGWKRVASVGELDCGILPIDSTWSIILRFSDHAQTDSYYPAGKVESGKDLYFAPNRASADRHYYFNGGAAFAVGRVSSGVMAIAGSKGYYNGVSEATMASPWSGGSVNSIHFLAANGGSDITDVYEQVTYVYNITLTPTQVANLTTLIANLT